LEVGTALLGQCHATAALPLSPHLMPIDAILARCGRRAG
jgi:hypothetical protein